MAIVTGLTAEAMQAIRDGVIVDAEVIGGNLILTKYDTTTIDAGSVIGPTGAPGVDGTDGATGPAGPAGNTPVTSGTRPSSPPDGQQIFETDTYKTLLWYEDFSAWLPPWNTSWGLIGKQVFTAASPLYGADSNTDFVLTDLQVYDGRSYEISVNADVGVGAGSLWALDITGDAAFIGRAALCYEAPSLAGEHIFGAVPYDATATETVTFRVRANELSGAGGFAFAASASSPREFWVKDTGPAV